jgi:hypothetical protein
MGAEQSKTTGLVVTEASPDSLSPTGVSASEDSPPNVSALEAVEQKPPLAQINGTYLTTMQVLSAQLSRMEADVCDRSLVGNRTWEDLSVKGGRQFVEFASPQGARSPEGAQSALPPLRRPPALQSQPSQGMLKHSNTPRLGSTINSFRMLSARALNTVAPLSSRLLTSARQTIGGLIPKQVSDAVTVRKHNDPKQVCEKLNGLSLRAAFNQPIQLKGELALGKNVNKIDWDDDRTPLHWAAARGHREIVFILLEAGADRTARDKHGRTPAELALECDQPGIHEIINYGPRLEDGKKATGYEGAISQLCMRNEPRELESMLCAYTVEKDERIRELISVNRRDVDGDRFPLHWAAARGAITCAHMLIDAGADISALDANGETAADLAARLNQRTMHELLIQAAIDTGDIAEQEQALRKLGHAKRQLEAPSIQKAAMSIPATQGQAMQSV